MNRLFSIVILLCGVSITGSAQLETFSRPFTKKFPDGYSVIEGPKRSAKLIKRVPGPADANVKAQVTTAEGTFYLSDWSWDRRTRGQSHYWIFSGKIAPAGGLQVYQAARKISLKHGFEIVASPSGSARSIKTVSGPTEAVVMADIRVAGQTYYISDWSWRLRAEGKPFNWIRPRKDAPPAAGLTIYSNPKKVVLKGGFDIVESPSQSAKSVKSIPGPTDSVVVAEKNVGGKLFYISDWSWQRRAEGKPFNWIRPMGFAAPPVPDPVKPKIEFTFQDSPYPMIFEEGYLVYDGPEDDAKLIRKVTEPELVEVLGMAEVGSQTIFLNAENTRRYRAGRSTEFYRQPGVPRLSPGDASRVQAAAKEVTLPRDAKFYLDYPWRLSVDAFGVNPDKAGELYREFPIQDYLVGLTKHFDDAEFPLGWAQMVGRVESPEKVGELIAVLEEFQAKRKKILQLYRSSPDLEMEQTYAQAAVAFDQRLIATWEAALGNDAAAEAWLKPFIAGWNPGEDGMNASGPKINILREIARAQWRQGKNEEARQNTRIWLDAYARDLASQLLHPDYIRASDRFTEFDSDFEAIGGYFDLLNEVTDPAMAAEIVVGLKGLRLAVKASNRTKESPELKALKKKAQAERLAGRELDYQLRDRISILNSLAGLQALTGRSASLAEQPEWRRLDSEIRKKRQAGQPEYKLMELEQKRDRIALDFIIDQSRFIASPKDVVAKLHDGEVLIDFYRTRGSEGEVYRAIVLKNSAPPQQFEIGTAGEIDAYVKRFQDFVNGTGEFLQTSLEDLEKASAGILKQGFDLVLADMLGAQEEIRKVTVCPEGQLMFLPFDSLMTGQDLLVGEKWQVSYVNGARDLVPEAAKEDRKGTAILVGNPTFDAPIQLAEQGAPKESAEAFVSRAGDGIEFVALPGTADEIRKLVPKLKSVGISVQTLDKAKATEKELLGMIQSPSILHLATHGFFLPEIPVKGRLQTDLETEGEAMLRSGLTLAGAQTTLDHWRNGKIPDPGNDGMLLASELAAVNLSETKLVVLSACETAQGEVLSGEGVEGLRSALALAGAETVVLTLWVVDDAATVNLMESFYDEFLSGTEASRSLAKTKATLSREMIESDGLYLATRFFGPFVATRRGR